MASHNILHAQQHDKYWMGSVSGGYAPVLMGFEGGGDISYQAAADSTPIINWLGTVVMADAAGQLQFYTNGNSVATWDNQIMQGGQGFNEGSQFSDWFLYNDSYYPYAYQVIPDAYDADTYYMVHGLVVVDTCADCVAWGTPKMQLSKIDMSANGGKGKVVYKNRYFDEVPMGLHFAMVRHGNGKDWWVVRRSNDGLYYRSTLLHRDTAVLTVESTMPGLSSDWFGPDDWDVTISYRPWASRDGRKLLDLYGVGKAKLMDFDRCTGAVSLVDTFTAGSTVVPTPGDGPVVCPIYSYEFSPSGRYLYGAGCAGIVQWNLWADDFQASKVQLSGPTWQLDDFQNVIGILQQIWWVFAHGPDGKIYYLVGNSHSVIEHPDEPGLAAGFCLAAENPPSCIGVPYWLISTPYPNYRLGPLVGSGCDTILSSVSSPVLESGYGVSASPNVASGQVEVGISLPSYGSMQTEVQVVDMLGRVVERHRFPPYAYLHTLDVSGWPAGAYNVVLLEEGRVRAGARLLVAR